MYASELLGKVIKPNKGVDCKNFLVGTNRRYVITEVFPFHVVTEVTCENGYTFLESFGISDLVTMGLFASGKHYERNEKGAKYGYSWNK